MGIICVYASIQRWHSFVKNQLKNLQIPILVIGTKSDLVDDGQRMKQLQRTGNIGEWNIQTFLNRKLICVHSVLSQLQPINADPMKFFSIVMRCAV